jgi:hypothetical protein
MVGQTRAWLGTNLFPSAPSAHPARRERRPTHVAAWVAIAAGLVLVQLARMSGSAPLNSLWAEDGARWLADALHRGFFSALSTTYDGYLQTVSRLVAEPVSVLPAAWFAPAMALSGALIVAGCAFVVWWASAGHIASPYLRGVLAAMIVLTPVAGVEVYDNVTNSIWFLMFLSFWLLLWRPATMARAVGAACLLFLAAVSTIGVALMLPLWLLRAFAIRDRRDGVIVAGYAAGVVIEAATLSTQGGGFPARWDWNLFPAYAQRVIGGAVTGGSITGALWRHIGTPVELVLAAGLLAFVAVALVRAEPRVRAFVAIAVVLSLGIFVISGYERGVTFALLWPRGSSNADGARYIVVPTLLLTSALFVVLDARVGAVSPETWRTTRAATAALVALAALFSFNVASSARGTPRWTASLNSARYTCAHTHVADTRVPVDPLVFGFSLPLPCSKAG